MINPNKLRKHVLRMVYEKKSGHIGGSFSLAELISFLYSNFNLISNEKDSPKLILSKGHTVPIIYAVLYELGCISEDDLSLFREIDSPLQGHPDKLRLKYLHATTGSLGQGLSIAIGHALGLKLKKSSNPVFCILGDGEIQEGQIWEGFMLAPKFKLNNLITFIDYNGSQSDSLVSKTLDLEPLKEKITSFNWNVVSISGNNLDEIERSVMDNLHNLQKKPTCVLLNTKKGKGVSFMQSPEWHAKVPNEEEYQKALEELNC
jgi:transketolase